MTDEQEDELTNLIPVEDRAGLAPTADQSLPDPTPETEEYYWKLFTKLTVEGMNGRELAREEGCSAAHISRVKQWCMKQLEEVKYMPSLTELKFRLSERQRKYAQLLKEAEEDEDRIAEMMERKQKPYHKNYNAILAIMKEARANDMILAKVAGWLTVNNIEVGDKVVNFIMPTNQYKPKEVVDAKGN